MCMVDALWGPVMYQLFRLQEPFNGCSQYGSGCDKEYTGRTPPHQTCVTMETCVMTSHVCHSGQGSVISDCLELL